MLKEERRIKIIDYVNKQGFVRNNVLAKEFDATIQTIISDITYLNEQNLLIKVYGGAKSNLVQTFELTNEEKTLLNIEQKQDIAFKAAELIADGDRVFIDTGTTTLRMCEYLVNKNIQIVTNGYLIAKELLELGIPFTLIGGNVRPETGAITGSLALNILDNFTFDKAFIGANAIDGNWIYTTQIDEAIFKKSVVEHSKENYFLLDQSKFNKISSVKVIDKNKVNVITNN